MDEKVSRLVGVSHDCLERPIVVSGRLPALDHGILPRVSTTVPRAGQNGHFHCAKMNKKACRVGKKGVENSCQTKADFTAKSITPMDGFVCHGEVKEDWLVLKGCRVGVIECPLIL